MPLGVGVGLGSSASGLTANGGGGVEPAVQPMTFGLTTTGMSLASGFEVPAGQKGITKRSQGHNGATPSDLDLAGCVETAISGAFVNFASGGTTPEQVATAFAGLSADDKAKSQFTAPFRNEVPNEATIADAAAYDLTHMATIWGAKANNRILVMGVTGGESRMTERWGRRILANKALWRTYSGYVFDGHRALVQAGGTGTGDDLTCAQLDVVPFTYRDGVDTAVAPTTGDTVHWNEAGNQIVADTFVSPAVRAWEGLRPYITDYEEVYLADAAAVAAQTNGGAVHPVVAHGSPITYSLPAQEHSAHFAINASTGAITRASATVLTGAYYDLTVRVANSYGYREGVRRIFIGKTSTAPKIKSLNGTAAVTVLTRTLGLGTDAKGSFAFRVRPQLNGRFLLGPGNGRIIVQMISGRWNVILKNAAGTNVVNATTRLGLNHTLGAWGWVWISFDLSTSSPMLQLGLELDGGGADFGSPVVTTLTGSSVVDFNNADVMQLFCSSPSPTAPGVPLAFNGSVEQMLMVKGVAMDWALHTQIRDPYRDPDTGAAKDLGPDPLVGGVAPFLNLGELSAGDLAYGYLGSEIGHFGAPFNPAGISG